MSGNDRRWNAEDLFAELDELKALQDASRLDHDARMTRISATTSIPVSREADVERAQGTAQRMGGICRLPEGRLTDLARIVGELAEGLVRDGGGFLRLTPVPGSSHLAVLVEAEGPRGRTRCVLDVAALQDLGGVHEA